MTKGYDFDTPIDRVGTGSLKWDRYAGRDVIPLWMADMDFRSPPAVLDALHRRIDHGIFGYTSAPDSLTEAVLDHAWRQYAWRLEPEWIVWLPELVVGLHVACRAAGASGVDALTATPIYPPFLHTPPGSGATRTAVPLQQQASRWTFDWDAMEAAVTERTRVFLFCSPHNPVGRVWSREELGDVAAFCQRHDLLLCSDEIHCDLVLDETCRHVPAASLGPEIAARSVTLMAPSKTYNMPGLGVALAIIPDGAWRTRFKRAMAGFVPHVNLLGLVAAEAAYRLGEPWRLDLLAYLRGNAKKVQEAVAAMPGLSMAPVEATYLAWIDTRAARLEAPCSFFEQAGVGLSDGAEFGAPGFVRLNFACPRARLDEALRRMTSAWTARPGGS